MNQQAISLDDRGRHDPSAALPAAFERQPLSPALFSPVEAALRQDLSEGLQQLFTRLTPRERQVITLRFGLDGDGEHSCQEIGQQLQLSRSIIEAHGGRLWPVAHRDHGATFQFTLPTEGGSQPG
jgi:DNA-directed RNA polymerase sigma subunit (sigma70/sigma32)